MVTLLQRRVAAWLAALATAGCGRRADAPAAGADSGVAAATVLAAASPALPESLAARLRGASVSAETSLAGYTIRCYSVNPQYPLGVAVFDGPRVVWSAGARGDDTKEMDVDEVARCPFRPGALGARGALPPFGTDLNRDGAPDFAVTTNVAVYEADRVGLTMVSLSRPFRAEGIAFTDSVGVRPAPGDSAAELVVTDISMNDLDEAVVRPVAVFAWRGGRWTLAADRMRTPTPDAQALDAEARRLIAIDSNMRPYALSEALIKLVAGGHEDEAWGLMRRVLPDSAQADYQRVLRQQLAGSSLRSLLKP